LQHEIQGVFGKVDTLKKDTEQGIDNVAKAVGDLRDEVSERINAHTVQVRKDLDRQGQETDTFVLSNSATSSLVVPPIIKAFIIGAFKNKPRNIDNSIRILWPERKGIIFFLPLFTNKNLADVWERLYKTSRRDTYEFVKKLVLLPSDLSFLYRRAKASPYQHALRYQDALENLLKESLMNEVSEFRDLLFTYSDLAKDLFTGEDYAEGEVPVDKLLGRYHRKFVGGLIEYYAWLDTKLPIIKQNEPPLPKDRELIIKRTGSQATSATFWAHYITETFRQTFGKPMSRECALFVNTLFNTDYKYNEINSLTRM